MSKRLCVREYPSAKDVDRWLDSIWALAASMKCAAELLPEQGFTHNLGIRHT